MTVKVMKEIVAWEKRRVGVWIGAFAVIILALVVIGIVEWGAARERMNEQGTWELVAIVSEDIEVVKDYGQEVVETVWAEAPKGEIVVGMTALGLVAILVWGTRKKRQKLAKKIEQVVKYEKKKL